MNQEFSKEEIENELKNLKIFRKGPFLINGIKINSHWNSFIKWKYLLKVLESLESQMVHFKNKSLKVLDIGSNNGYYSFLLYYHLKQKGFLSKFDLIDPIVDFYQQYLFLKKIFPAEDQKNWNFYSFGWQEIPSLNTKYDLILCMGILYHHKNPMELLDVIYHQLNKKGILILETITIRYSKYPILLIPKNRYIGSKGFWFIPNKMALLNMLQKTNFSKIQFHSERFVLREMEKNHYLPSLKELVDKNQTIENYPKPYRSFFSAIK